MGTWILPCLSVPREGKGRTRGWRKVNHSHTYNQVSWGDRTSGFNGVRTSGPFRLHPRKGSRKRTRVNPRKGSCHGLLLPTMCLFSSLGHLPVASWATQKQVREVKAAQAPESSRRCPWGRDAHAACGGNPQSTAMS